MLLRPHMRFSEAGAGLGLWDLKSLRFEQVDRNQISWQNLSLELQPYPSSVSAAEAPGAAVLSQLCSGKAKLCLMLALLRGSLQVLHPQNCHGETGKCQRAHWLEPETEGVEGFVCSGAGGAAMAMLRSQAGDIQCCLLPKTFGPK